MSQVAVVTGSAKGLGKAFVLALTKAGFLPVIHYRSSKNEAYDLLRSVKKDAKGALVLNGDLTDEKQVNSMFEEIYKKLGRVDLLVNNVGDFIYKEFSKTTFGELKNIVESNIYASFLCSRAVLPFMRKVKSGHIVNIGTVGVDSFTIREKSTPYFMAKNALYFLTKVMAWEEAKGGIHINMISPASLETDIFKAGDFPMGRSVNYDDLIKTLLFLISKDAYYINGANIEVAGAFIPGMK